MDESSLNGRVRTLGHELWRDGRGWIFLAVTVGWFLSIGGRLVFPVLIPRVRVALGLDLTTAGLVLTALWMSYALTQFPGGILGDRFGERAILVASTSIAAGGVLVTVLAPGLGAFLLGTVLFGGGTGLFSTTRMTIISDVYPQLSGTAMGLSQAVGNVGTAVLPVVAGLVAATVLGWRGGVGVLFAPLALAATALWFIVPARTRAESVETDRSLASVLDGVLRPAPLLVAGMMLTMSFVYQGFTSFYPTYLVTEKALSDGTASALFGLFFATGVVVQPLAGLSADRFGAKPTFAVCILISVAGLAVLPLVEGVVALAALTVVLGVQLGFWSVANAFAIEVLPAAVQGSGFGLVRTSYLIFAALSPTVIGALADAGLFNESFFLLAGIAAVALALGTRLPTPA